MKRRTTDAPTLPAAQWAATVAQEHGPDWPATFEPLRFTTLTGRTVMVPGYGVRYRFWRFWKCWNKRKNNENTVTE